MSDDRHDRIMNDLTVGRVIRAVRIRKGWRQVDVAVRASVSQQEVSLIELGRLDAVCLRTLRKVGTALEVDLPLAPRWRGPELDRLLDAEHAALVDAVIRILHADAWEALPEWTFNHYGERGSVDVVAWHPATRTLLIVEVKTRIVDVQDLLATHGRKVRIAPLLLADEREWRPTTVGALLVVPEGSVRKVVARHAATFASAYPARTREVRQWLRVPRGPLRGIAFLPATSGASAEGGDPRTWTTTTSGTSRSRERRRRVD
jgi:transcriptional regulator with XRE-family HTH domain